MRLISAPCDDDDEDLERARGSFARLAPLFSPVHDKRNGKNAFGALVHYHNPLYNHHHQRGVVVYETERSWGSRSPSSAGVP